MRHGQRLLRRAAASDVELIHNEIPLRKHTFDPTTCVKRGKTDMTPCPKLSPGNTFTLYRGNTTKTSGRRALSTEHIIRANAVCSKIPVTVGIYNYENNQALYMEKTTKW